MRGFSSDRASGGLSRRTLAILAAIVLPAGLVAGCAAVRTLTDAPSRPSVYGSYLAGLHAGGQGELDVAVDFFTQALRGDPDNAALRERVFLMELSQGRMAEAVSLARARIAADQGRGLDHLVVGLTLLQAGQPQAALASLDLASADPSTLFAGLLTAAWAARDSGDSEAARARMDTLARLGGLPVIRDFHGALMDDVAGWGQEAEAAYLAVIQATNGVPPRIVEAYGSFLERDGRPEMARKLYMIHGEVAGAANPLVRESLDRLERNAALPPPLVSNGTEGAAEVLYSLASVLAGELASDAPVFYLRLALALRPDLDDARLLLGDRYLAIGDDTAALKVWRSIPAGSPFYLDARIRTAETLADARGKNPDDTPGDQAAAISELMALARRFPDRAEPLMVLGDVHRAQEHYAKSEAWYSRALEVLGEPEAVNWPLVYAHGITYERLGRWPEAERELRRAVDLSGRHPLTLNYLGYSWIDRKENLGEALEMVREAVAQRPADGYIVDSLGWGHYQMEDYDTAVGYLEQAVALQPGDAVINDHLGDAFWRMGRRLEARFQWRHALDLKPADADQVRLIEDKLRRGLEPHTAPDATDATDATDAGAISAGSLGSDGGL